MPTSAEWMDYLKVGAAFGFGGLAGAILTNIIAARRARIQPVGKKLTVSYVDLPEILKGYGAHITITPNNNALFPEPLHFKKLAVIQLELVNTGNKDLESFKLGINLPEGTEAIGFQAEGEDRYHTIESDKKVSADSGASELDIEMKPFNRNNKYVITIIANTDSDRLREEIKLSKSIPVKFVDLDERLIVTTSVLNFVLRTMVSKL